MIIVGVILDNLVANQPNPLNMLEKNSLKFVSIFFLWKFSSFSFPVRSFLLSLGFSALQIARKATDTARVIDCDGVKIARYGNVFCSKYNKPEALRLFLQQESLTPKRIVFADDNLTNCFNMFMEFAAKQEQGNETGNCERDDWFVFMSLSLVDLNVTCFWYEPPSTGHAETVSDDVSMQLAHKFMQLFEGKQAKE